MEQPQIEGRTADGFALRARIMPSGNRHSAYRQFVERQAQARKRRAQRRALVLGALLPVSLASCVVQTPAPRAQNLPPPVARLAADDPVSPLFVAAPMPPPGGPSFLAGRSARDQVRATLCLASAIYYEAATEPDEGQRAVAQVVLNRVRHAAWPNTVCGVVYQGSERAGCQFSFACDGAMARTPSLAWWTRARRVAEAALAGAVYEQVGSATFYHTTEVFPAWRTRLIPVGTIGAHIFYRQPGDGPEAALLPMRYAGFEPVPGPLPRIVPPAQLAQIDAALPGLLPVVPVRDAGVIAPSASLAATAPPRPSRVADDKRYLPGALPESDVRPEFRDSGTWIAGR